MRRGSGAALCAALAASIALGACAPTPPGASPREESRGGATAVQRALVVIGRGEPPNIAAKSIVTYSASGKTCHVSVFS